MKGQNMFDVAIPASLKLVPDCNPYSVRSVGEALEGV